MSVKKIIKAAAGVSTTADDGGDEHFTSTSLLINADGNQGDNNLYNTGPIKYLAFTDNSGSFQKSLSVIGQPYATEFNPYQQNYSYFFDGAGDWLYFANNAGLAPGTGNFTIECWVNFKSIPSSGGFNAICQNDAVGSSGSDKFWLGLINDSGTLQLRLGRHATSSGTRCSWPTVRRDTWYHVAAVRSSGIVSLFIDGVLQSSTNTADFNGVSLGQNGFSVGTISTPYYFEGYISNLRYTVGQALYTSTFYPAMLPLGRTTQGAISSNVKLITAKSKNFADDSVYPDLGLSFTVNGNPKVSPFQPFPIIKNNYSVLFNGNSYLAYETSSTFNQNVSAWTMEVWAYSIGTGTMYFWGQTSNNYLNVRHDSGGTISVDQAFVGIRITSNRTFPRQEWLHVALSYDGTTLRLFVNGTIEGSITGISYGSSTTQTRIGDYTGVGSSVYNGYLSNFRFTRAAVYTSDFSLFGPQSSPLTPTLNDPSSSLDATSILTCQANTFIDLSPDNVPITTSASPPVIREFQPFGISETTYGSGYFDGTGDYLNIPDSEDFNLDNFPFGFTMEFALYPESWSSDGVLGIIGQWSSSNRGWIVYVGPSSITFSYSTNGSNFTNITASVTNNLNEWMNVAIVRSSGSLLFFKNSKLITTLSIGNPTIFNSTRVLHIGATQDGGYGPVKGYISDIRLLMDEIAYNSNYNLQKQPLPTTDFCYLLTCQYSGSIRNLGFIDESPYTRTAFITGNPTQGSFSPFSSTTLESKSSSYSFASLNYITTNITSFNLEDKDFVIECWINPNIGSSDTNPKGLVTKRPGSDSSFWFALASNRIYYAHWGSGGATSAIGNTVMQNGKWYHVAVTRTRTTGSTLGIIRLFVNGILEAVLIEPFQAFTNTNPLTIGRINNNTTTRTYEGLISNLRICWNSRLDAEPFSLPYYTNSSAIGQKIFDVPVGPLTRTNTTLLLTLQDTTLVDNSINAYTLTPQSSVPNTTSSPFSYIKPYDPKYHAGSGFFNGTSDYITFYGPSGKDLGVDEETFAFGTGDFTVECFFYALDATGSRTLVSTAYPTDFQGFWMGISGGQFYFLADEGTSPWSVSLNGGTVSARTWYHMVAQKKYDASGGTFTLYVNGTVIATQTTSPNLTNSNFRVHIGGRDLSSQYFNGFISSVRIVRGRALYAGNSAVTPSPNLHTPLDPVYGTILLVNFRNAGILDQTRKTNLITTNNLAVDTLVKKFGTGSIKSVNSTGYIVARGSDENQFVFGTSDFTIEMWIYITNVSATGGLYDCRPTSTQGNYPCLYIAGSTIRYFVNNADRITSGTLSNNQWYHVALSRNSGVSRLFINGVQAGSNYSDSGISYLCPVDRPVIGDLSFTLGSNILSGYIDDVRVTKGVGRYPSAFSVRTTAFPTFQSATSGGGGGGGGGAPPSGTPTTVTYNYISDADQTFVVPAGVTSISVKMWGGGGGSNRDAGAGGGGGYTTANIAVTPLETLIVRVGEGGLGGGLGTSETTSIQDAANRLTGGTGGWPGGGTGGGTSSYGAGGGGGGYSAIFRSTTPLIIAGGGGGGGDDASAAAGGGSSGGSAQGGGGTQSAGGSSAAPVSVASGSLQGASGTSTGGGGGGGGGFYGGGLGGVWGGGGGGSGYIGGSGVTNATTTAGSGTTPGNSSDSDRGDAGNGAPNGGTGESSTSTFIGIKGKNGKVIISYVASALYDFETVTFSTSVTGPTGPTLAEAQGAMTGTPSPSGWNTNTDYFNVNSGILLWTVPATGTYRILAAGARGNPAGSNNGGATIRGDFSLTQGQKLRIVVGQVGTGNGGGGGSYVVKETGSSNEDIYVIAGGGGGKTGGTAGTATTTNAFGDVSNGQGGNANSGSWNGPAGGGYFSNGVISTGSPRGNVGFGFLLGASGGAATGGGSGGFGGGGSGGADSAAGGGCGGGYSGGTGGPDGSSGSGAGSYPNGSNQLNTANANPNAGYVTITKL